MKPTWQYVALAGLGGGFFLGLFVVIPDSQPQMRTALLGLVLLAGQAAVLRFLHGRVSDVSDQVSDVGDQVSTVDEKVNGRMSQILIALRQAHMTIAAQQAQLRDVSRETPPAPPAGDGPEDSK